MKTVLLSDAKDELKALVPAFAARVAPVFRLMGWEWGDGGGVGNHIPREDEIGQTLDDVIDKLDEDHWKTGTGGLSVFYDEVNGIYGLELTVASNGYFNPTSAEARR